jgi:hypothetical protein
MTSELKKSDEPKIHAKIEQAEVPSKPSIDSALSAESEFQNAAQEPVPGFWKEFALFLWQSPSWWLAPLIIMLVLLGLAVTMIPVEAMPFIYTLW